MKVLWFEVTPPSRYFNKKMPIAGWQDALENIVFKCSDIELFVSFETKDYAEIKKIDGITYIPFKIKYSKLEQKRNEWTYDIYKEKILKSSIQVIESVQPDLIQVFGCEWPFGLVAEKVDIPVVIHIQGSIVSYTNANFPPGYNYLTKCKYAGLSFRQYFHLYKSYKRIQSHLAAEYQVWNYAHFYMGRTCWDESLVTTLSPNSIYYHVDEALREHFLKSSKRWSPVRDEKIRLVTIGLTTFWKGPDMLLKTAHILKNMSVNFEWNVVGKINSDVKKIVEKKEQTTFKDNNVKILGMKQPEELIDILCSSNIYVHTAYIENSPNSICEAQYLGLPIISTHVGGIETLLSNGYDGILTPANDPWRMASEIIKLSKDESMMREYGKRSMEHAHRRHNPETILCDLLKCYKDVISKYKANYKK